jgi:hypothetical protein
MKFNTVAAGFGATIAGLGLVLGFTNPTPEDYIRFAVDEGTEYLETEACTQKLPLVGNSLQDECVKFVHSEGAQDRIRKAIVEKTKRQNYLLFSIYRSDLSIQDVLPMLPGNLVPEYRVETVGFLKTFKIYETGEKDKDSSTP